MAGYRLTPPLADSPVDAYLAELASLLRGPRRRRSQILTELRDGLDHAVDDLVADGLPRAEAEKDAVAQFGTPQRVAKAFTGELATAYARRTIATYIVTGPLVGIWWLLLLQPRPWRTGLIALLIAIPVLPLVVVAVATATTTLATTGRLIRWLPETSPRRALAAATAIAGLVLAADTAVIVIYARSNIPWQPLAAIAVAASLTRIAFSIITVRHAAAMRRATTDHTPPTGGGPDGRR
jgi:uncharacterized membrane protein